MYTGILGTLGLRNISNNVGKLPAHEDYESKVSKGYVQCGGNKLMLFI